MGFSTALLNIGLAYKYFDIEDAKEKISMLAKKLSYDGIPEPMCPFVMAVTGKGRAA